MKLCQLFLSWTQLLRNDRFMLENHPVCIAPMSRRMSTVWSCPCTKLSSMNKKCFSNQFSCKPGCSPAWTHLDWVMVHLNGVKSSDLWGRGSGVFCLCRWLRGLNLRQASGQIFWIFSSSLLKSPRGQLTHIFSYFPRDQLAWHLILHLLLQQGMSLWVRSQRLWYMLWR